MFRCVGTVGIVIHSSLECQLLSDRFLKGKPMDSLRAYVQEVMQQKNLKGVDVEANSGGTITNSYVSGILAGKNKRLSVEKVNALAKGLGVDSVEVFRAASGENIVTAPKETISVSFLVSAVNRIVASPELVRIVQIVLTLKPARLKVLLKQLEKE